MLIDPVTAYRNPLPGLPTSARPAGPVMRGTHNAGTPMFDVIALDTRRRGGRAEDPLRCSCGGEWFVLDGGSAAPEGLDRGAVCLNVDGTITGYFGTLRCNDCGQHKNPEPERGRGTRTATATEGDPHDGSQA